MIPPGGLDCFGNGFLPASFQGSLFQRGEQPVADLKPTEGSVRLQQGKLDLLRKLDRAVTERMGHEDKLESAIGNYELAFRMQTAVPDLMDLSKETAATKKLYGVDDGPTDLYGRQCLIARRLVERGVRFIELLCPHVGHDRWDQHSGLKKGHEDNARATDQPVAALLKDLKSRGLLDSTLVVWAGEFGRTPMAQGSDGRDHNPFGFSVWLGRRRRQGRRHPRRHRRLRLSRRRQEAGDARPARHHAAPARHGPQEIDLPLGRARHAPDRRARRGHQGSAGVTGLGQATSKEHGGTFCFTPHPPASRPHGQAGEAGQPQQSPPETPPGSSGWAR